MEREKHTVFCFDASALIDLHKYYGQESIPELWKELDKLLIENRIISHRIVFEELTTNAKRPSSLSKWVASKREHFREMTETQAQHVASIISQFPGLIDPHHEKDQADPWLIALVIEERSKMKLFASTYDVAIVSQENPERPNRIPAVCKHYEIQHLNLSEFFDFNGWKLKLEKSQ